MASYWWLLKGGATLQKLAQTDNQRRRNQGQTLLEGANDNIHHLQRRWLQPVRAPLLPLTHVMRFIEPNASLTEAADDIASSANSCVPKHVVNTSADDNAFAAPVLFEGDRTVRIFSRVYVAETNVRTQGRPVTIPLIVMSSINNTTAVWSL